MWDLSHVGCGQRRLALGNLYRVQCDWAFEGHYLCKHLWMRRAMQDCDVYLLDDVLAAVDAHVAAQLWERAICGPLLARTNAPCRAGNNPLHNACKGFVGMPGAGT